MEARGCGIAEAHQSDAVRKIQRRASSLLSVPNRIPKALPGWGVVYCIAARTRRHIHHDSADERHRRQQQRVNAPVPIGSRYIIK